MEVVEPVPVSGDVPVKDPVTERDTNADGINAATSEATHGISKTRKLNCLLHFHKKISTVMYNVTFWMTLACSFSRKIHRFKANETSVVFDSKPHQERVWNRKPKDCVIPWSQLS